MYTQLIKLFDFCRVALIVTHNNSDLMSNNTTVLRYIGHDHYLMQRKI